jgi:uncharacterized membrane protein
LQRTARARHLAAAGCPTCLEPAPADAGCLWWCPSCPVGGTIWLFERARAGLFIFLPGPSEAIPHKANQHPPSWTIN